MKLPPLIVITDVARYGRERTLARLSLLLAAAVPGSVMVQQRDRRLPGHERLAFARELRQLTRHHGQLLCINDRLDLALIVDSDAVHLGERSVSPADARALVGPERIITCACHEPALLTHAAAADAYLLSPVFSPRKGNLALGFKLLERARSMLAANDPQRALYALGGVDAAAAARCAKIGVGVAVIGAAFDPADPAALLSGLGIAG
ncbi:MAG TPA: thiamine phosphate synthase [Polyangiaceae bacterium]|nr:thiamine phosphate synthase [Polyangiaceae bacterium]